MEEWNGVSVLASLYRSHPTAVLPSDASGGWGCGAFTSRGAWFSGAVVQVMGVRAYHGQRARSHCTGVPRVGSRMERRNSALSV